jgi:hypothetical protein
MDISSSHSNEGLQRPAVLFFLLGAAFAAAWLALNFVFPGLGPTGIPTAITRVAIHSVILAGLWLGLARTGFALGRRAAIWLAIAVPFTLWLAAVWSFALNGGFQPVPGIVRPPLLPVAIFAPLIVALPLLMPSRTIGAALDAVPASWLIALQVYRVFGGIFFVNWANGAVPGVFAFPAGTGDVITGVLALPVAWLVATGTARGMRAGLAWNAFGLFDFAVAIAMGALTSPGPFQVFGIGGPVSQVGAYPTVMIPAFAVPSSIILHALSIRQLTRMRRRAVAPSDAVGTEAAVAA